MHPSLADKYHCTGCLACADSCGQKAITCIIDEEGFYAYKVEEDKCVLCHRCEKACPIVCNMQYGSNVLNLSKPYAAWSTNDEFRKKATSGGVFPAVAKSIIEQGGVVYGAVQEQYYVHHEGIEHLDDIAKLQGSKYTQSKTEGIYRQVKASLNSGSKVLFTGVGCQVAALLSFLKGNKNLDNLFTIDLICGGVTSTFLIKKFVEQYGGQFEAIASYRTKSKYIFSVKDKDGKIRAIPNSERPLPLCGFTSGAAERYSCYDCPFAKGHRNSDITIGDYWGNAEYSEQKENGVSVAVVHTEKGLKVLQESELEIHEIGWRSFVLSNPRMVWGKGEITSTRRNIAKNFTTYSYEQILEAYANKGIWLKPWTMVSRALRILEGIRTTKKRQRLADKILRDNNL